MKKYINLLKVIILILITLLCFSKPNNVYGITDLEDIAVPLDPDNGEDEHGIGIKPNNPNIPNKPGNSGTSHFPTNGGNSSNGGNSNSGDGATDLGDIAVPLDPDDGNGSSSGSSTGAPIKDPITNPDFYKPSDTTSQDKEFVNIVRKIIGVMQAVGTVIAVIAFMLIGLKYMMGSVEEKAKYKELLLPYLVGCAAVYGALGIWQVFVKILGSV